MGTEKQVAELYAKLISVARAQTTIHYSDIAPIVGVDMSNPPDRDYLGHLLGDISRAEAHEGRPMLSSIVWHKGENTIGTGFQKLGKELGLRRYGDDDDSFLIRELQRTHDTWDPDASTTHPSKG